jgi:ankyrin repeat protein
VGVAWLAFLLQACRYLLEAVKAREVNRTKIWVKYASEKCTTSDQYRSTLLMVAAANDGVDVLLESGTKAERTDFLRRTARHYAAWNGHLDVCRLLLEWGAKVDPLNKWKETPLHFAARAGHLSVVKLLVARGADVRLKDENGQTARDLARSSLHGYVADWLASVTRV